MDLQEKSCHEISGSFCLFSGALLWLCAVCGTDTQVPHLLIVGSKAPNSEVWDLLLPKSWSSRLCMLSIDISQIDLNAISMHPPIEDIVLVLRGVPS